MGQFKEAQRLNSTSLIKESKKYYVNEIVLNNRFEIASFNLEKLLEGKRDNIQYSPEYYYDVINNAGSVSITVDVLKALCSMQETKKIRFCNMQITEKSNGKYEIKFLQCEDDWMDNIPVIMEDKRRHPLAEKYGSDNIAITKIYSREPYSLFSSFTMKCFPIEKVELTVYKGKKEIKIEMSARELIREGFLIVYPGCREFYQSSGFSQLDMDSDMLVFVVNKYVAKIKLTEISPFESEIEIKNNGITHKIKVIQDNKSKDTVEKWVNKLKMLGCNIQATDVFLKNLSGNIKEITVPDILGFKEDAVSLEGATINITSANTIITRANNDFSKNKTKVVFKHPDSDYVDSIDFLNKLAHGNKTMMKMIEVYVENRLYSDNNIELNTITAGEAVEV